MRTISTADYAVDLLADQSADAAAQEAHSGNSDEVRALAFAKRLSYAAAHDFLVSSAPPQAPLDYAVEYLRSELDGVELDLVLVAPDVAAAEDLETKMGQIKTAIGVLSALS